MSATEEVVAQGVEADEAAFAAGFSETRGDEPPVEPVVEPEVAKTEEPAPENDPPVVEEQQPQNLIAGLTEEQVKDLLIKAGEVDSLRSQVDKLFGKHGEVNRTLQQLQARTEAGAPVEITEEDLADFAEEYPELAQSQLKLLQKFASKLHGTGPAAAQPQVDVEALSSGIRDELRTEFEERLIKRAHRDFVDVVQSQDFNLWMTSQLNEEERTTLVASKDADLIIDRLDQFKAWQEAAAKQIKQKQKRLESAVTPRGDSTPLPTSQSEEDAFANAFKAVRAGHF